MKKLLILLITFNAYAMTFEEIDSLTVNESLWQLMGRTDITCEFSVDPPIDQDDIRSNWERMVTIAPCVRPAFETFQIELASYKIDLTAIEQARLDEIARVTEWKARFATLRDLRRSMVKSGLNQPNAGSFVADIIAEKDEAKLIALESKNAEVIAEDDAKLAEKNQKTSDILEAKALFDWIKDHPTMEAELKSILKTLISHALKE